MFSRDSGPASERGGRESPPWKRSADRSSGASSGVKRDLLDLERTRRIKRQQRRRTGVPVIALVGYTNAGKSTLLKHLTDGGVLIQDQLFSTLDPTTRKLSLPHDRTVLITDTVGFVQKLPHQLVEAFRSTLEEVKEANLLLHVVDASRDVERQIAAVQQVLTEIGALGIPAVIALNNQTFFPMRRWRGCRAAPRCRSDLRPQGLRDRRVARTSRCRTVACSRLKSHLTSLSTG